MSSRIWTLPTNRGENVVELVIKPRIPASVDMIVEMKSVIGMYGQILELMAEGLANGSLSPVEMEAMCNRLVPVRDGVAKVIRSMAASGADGSM